MIKTLKVVAVLGFALAAQSISSQAITIGFGTTSGPFSPYVESGFSIDVARFQGGQCAAGVCMALNKNETPVLSLIGGGLFSLNSFWLDSQGKNSELTVLAKLNGITVSSLVLDGTKVGETISHLFANIDSIVFIDSGKGSVRIDNIDVTAKVSAVPLPAGLPLLVSGLFGLGLLKRRRDKAQA